jgi:hypothetical protein
MKFCLLYASIRKSSFLKLHHGGVLNESQKLDMGDVIMKIERKGRRIYQKVGGYECGSV